MITAPTATAVPIPGSARPTPAIPLPRPPLAPLSLPSEPLIIPPVLGLRKVANSVPKLDNLAPTFSSGPFNKLNPLNNDAAKLTSLINFPRPLSAPLKAELKKNKAVDAPSAAFENLSTDSVAPAVPLFAKLGILPVGSSLVLVTARPCGFWELRSFPL